MRARIKYGLLCLGIGLSWTGDAQGIKDTIVEMKMVPVQVNGKASSSVSVSHSEDNTIDGRYQTGKRLSDIIGESTSVFVKNYGVGQLSSISINGSSAAQTTVTWNGIKLNSPATGQVDLALFDMGTVDAVSVKTGASNQSIGGVLALSNNNDLNRDSIISNTVVRYGSFRTLDLSSNNIYRVGLFSGSTKINYIRSDNDFPFANNTQIGTPMQRQTNANVALLTFLQQIDLQVRHTEKEAINVGAYFWVTNADRQLPPTMNEPSGDEHEWDRSYRSVAYVKMRKNSFTFALKTAYLYDWLKYTNPARAIDSRSTSQASRTLINASYQYKKLRIDGVLSYDHELLNSTGLGTVKHRDIGGISISPVYIYRTLVVSISLKQELLGAKALPFAPAAFISYSRFVGNSNFYIRLNGARAYRIAGLNDLYWTEGGNPALRPEHAWNSNLNLEYNYKNALKIYANGFYNYVTDWILWHPVPNQEPWAADNVKRVISRGVNLSARWQNKASLADRGFVVAIYAGYSYTNTISLDAVSANDNSCNKQLIYVPLHNVNASLQLQYRHFYIRSIHCYTGLRYTATDDSQSLPGYYLTHLEIGKDFYFHNQQIGVSARMNNITNSQYQVVVQRAMPGRSYEMTVRLNLSK
jgi:iron complex outermembrane receptor protein